MGATTTTTAATTTRAARDRPRCGSVLVRGLIHRLRARDELMPIDHALALAAAIAHAIDRARPDVITPSAVLLFFDGTIELGDTGVRIGDELGYVAPERLLPRAHAADDVGGAVFGVGAVLYELLTGAAPFTRDSEAATRYAVLCETPVLPSTMRAELGEAIDQLIGVALAKDRDARFASGVELARAIEAAAQGAGLALAIDEVGRLGRRLAQGVRLAHTLRSPDVPVEDRSTRKMRITDLVRLGADVAPPPIPEPAVDDVDRLAFDLGDDDDGGSAPSVIAAGTGESPAVVAAGTGESPAVVAAGPTDAFAWMEPDLAPAAVAPAIELPPPPRGVVVHARARTTDQLRRAGGGRTAMAVATLLLVIGVVAVAAVPVFAEEHGPAPGPVAHRLVPAPVARPAVSSAAPAAVPVVVPVPAPAVAHPATALRRAMRSHDWTAAASACSALLGHTTSRRVRATCAVASCRAGAWPQHASFLAGLSRSRRADVARRCE